MALQGDVAANEDFFNAKLEELAAQLSVPGVDLEQQRQAISPNIGYAETAAILKLAKANPLAWNHLQRFIAKSSLHYAIANGEISYYKKPDEAFGQLMWNAGAAKGVALLTKCLLPVELEKRLDKLAKTDDNGRVTNGQINQSDLRGGSARWFPYAG